VLWGQIGSWFGRVHYRVSGRTDYGASDIICYAVAALVVAAGLFAIFRFLVRRQQTRRLPNPKRLFKELCRAHRLDRLSRRRLWRVAKSACPDQPARLFLEPEKIDFGFCQKELQMTREEVIALRRRLFTDLLADPIAQRNRSITRDTSEESPGLRPLPPFQPAPNDDLVWLQAQR
jgi:hypothetical protein